MHKLRKMEFGHSSEALDAKIHQLELKFENLKESKAACKAPAKNSASGRPQPERCQPVANDCRSICRAKRLFMCHVRFAPVAVAHNLQAGRGHHRCAREKPGMAESHPTYGAKLSCRALEAIIQAPSPDLPNEKGWPVGRPRRLVNHRRWRR